MTVTIKTTNYAFLEKVGVPAADITLLKDKGIKLALGFFDLKLVGPQGQELETYKLPKNTNELMKGQVPGPVLAGIQSGISQTIKNAVAALAGGPKVEVTTDDVLEAAATPKPQVHSPFKPLGEAAKTDPKLEAALNEVLGQDSFQKTPQKKVNPKELMAMPAISLKEAKLLYQPVNGSSKGSRYFVIAMNTHVRIAAKITGHDVSLRAEGTMPNPVRECLKKVGFDDHGGYMSGHFTCNDKATPERLIGSVLMGSGLEFETPLPSLAVIKNVK